MQMPLSRRPVLLLGGFAAVIALPGCSAVGAMMSPYSEKFSCKNDDHGQCIHPDRAYEDARDGITSKSDPAVTNDKAMLRGTATGDRTAPRGKRVSGTDYGDYRDSVYRELKGLIEAPVTPMLKAPRTVRTLILPYSDRQRPDRLYMPRYVYSVLDRPTWVIGGTLVPSSGPGREMPVLSQTREPSAPLDEPMASSAQPSVGPIADVKP
jgi:conjugal transfer pilus assembly protein TraV